MNEAADVIVVGLGPGGEEVASRLAKSGLDVIGIDGNLVGGECPYWGCVPSKMMIRAADLLSEGRRVPGMAGRAVVIPDWNPVARRIREEATDNWDDGVAVKRLEDSGARFVRGWAKLKGPKTVEVEGRRFEATRAVVLDVGAGPWAPPIPGLSETDYWTNRDAIEVEELPATLTVLGGGAIGVELGQVFSRFGVQVTIVEVSQHLLPSEEPESGQLLAEVLEAEGIAVHCGSKIKAVGRQTGQTILELENGMAVGAERLLVAAGRRPNLAALGASSIGVDEAARAIAVDKHMRVTEGVWAIGDATGKGAFTHMSLYQAAIAADDIMGQPGPGAQYHAVPRVTFTDPEIGSVGHSEASARDAGLEVRIAVSQIPDSARGWIHKIANKGFIKLVEDVRRGVLVGATSAGPVGGEVLSMLTLAVHSAIPVDDLSHMIYAYPTFHRAVEDAVKSLRSKGTERT
jgi:pyruvate/2-oxoglutarate dehydrogenase complex dihydrolipoamide dehydrogenase (E3) component